MATGSTTDRQWSPAVMTTPGERERSCACWRGRRTGALSCRLLQDRLAPSFNREFAVSFSQLKLPRPKAAAESMGEIARPELAQRGSVKR
jgi:hypothetical protein